MFHQTIKSLFNSSVSQIASNISQYTVHPEKDLSHSKKFPPHKLISFLVSQGSSSTKNELLDFFNIDILAPSASALNQQRAKLKPDAMEAVIRHFNSSTASLDKTTDTVFLLQMD